MQRVRRSAGVNGQQEDGQSGSRQPAAGETSEHNRELIEFLNELRVILPVVGVLFAFLLTVPFYARFATLTPLQEDVYFGAFLATALSSILLIQPSAYHRLTWRQHDKEKMLRTGNICSIVGLMALAVAIGGIIFLITDLVVGRGSAKLVSFVAGGLVLGLWFALPISRAAGRRSP